MKLALILLASLALLLFAAAMIGVFRIAARESREEERVRIRLTARRDAQQRTTYHSITLEEA